MTEPVTLAEALHGWAHSIATVASPRFWPTDTSTDGWGGRGIGQANQGWAWIDYWLQRVDGVKYRTGFNGLTIMELTNISIEKFVDSELHDTAMNAVETVRSEFDVKLAPGWDWTHDVLRSHVHTTSLAQSKAEAWKVAAEVQFGYAAGSAGGVQGGAKASAEYGQTLSESATATDAVTDAVHSVLKCTSDGHYKVGVTSDVQDRTQLVSVDAVMDFAIDMHVDLDRLGPTQQPAHWKSWRDVMHPGLLGFAPMDTSGSPFDGSTPMFQAVKDHPLTDHEKDMLAGPVRSLVTYEAPYQSVEIVAIDVTKV